MDWNLQVSGYEVKKTDEGFRHKVTLQSGIEPGLKVTIQFFDSLDRKPKYDFLDNLSVSLEKLNSQAKLEGTEA